MSQSGLSAMSSSFSFFKFHSLGHTTAHYEYVQNSCEGRTRCQSLGMGSCTSPFLTAQITSSRLMPSPSFSWTRATAPLQSGRILQQSPAETEPHGSVSAVSRLATWPGVPCVSQWQRGLLPFRCLRLSFFRRLSMRAILASGWHRFHWYQSRRPFGKASLRAEQLHW